jgi:hypothetical protein
MLATITRRSTRTARASLKVLEDLRWVSRLARPVVSGAQRPPLSELQDASFDLESLPLPFARSDDPE